MKKIRVLVADDHALMRMGLVALFRTDASLTVIGEAEDGFQAVELAVQTRPDVIVLDLQMPGLSGAEVVHAVKKKYPDVKIVILTTFSISDSIARALDAGAEGALLKSTPNEKLIDIVHRVADGKKYVSDEVKSLIESDLPLPPLSVPALGG